MGIAAGVFGVETNFAQQRANPLRNLLAGSEPVNLDPFGDGRADGHAGIQRAVRILKNDLHPPPEGAEGGSIEREYIGALEAGTSAGGLLQPKYCAPDRRLAAT